MSTANDPRQLLPVGTLLLGGLLAALLLLTYLLVRPPAPPDELQDVLRSPIRPLAPFHLNSRSHGPLDRRDLLGKWTLVFFGHRACEDPCANTLYELAAFRRMIDDAGGDDAGRVQVLFVSLDPARDSVEELADYVAAFDRHFIGATAGRAAVTRFARQFGVGLANDAQTANGQNAPAHGSDVFLVDPHARIVAIFSAPHYATELLAHYRMIAAYYAANS